MSKLAISVLVAISLTACSTVDVSEKQATTNLVKTLDKEWKGYVNNSFDGVINPYSIEIEDVKIKFEGGNKFHDVIIYITGNFSIDSNDQYSAKSKIHIKLAGHSELNKDSSELNISTLYTQDIQFDNLYNSYRKDITPSLKNSLDHISDIYFKSPSLLNFNGSTSMFLLFNSDSGYSLTKENDGNNIKITFKESIE